MRILIASDLHWPTINGIATFGRNLAQGLAADGHEVMVVAPSQTGRASEEMDGNYRISRTMSLVFPFYQNLRVSMSPTREIKDIVKKFKPDVIHVQTPLGVGLGAIAAAKKYDIPLVATNHAMSENLIDNMRLLAPFAKQIDFILRQYGHRFYGNADYVTLPTTAAIKMLKSQSFNKPLIAISNGVDLSRFEPGKASAEVRERFGIPARVPVVMYLGRLDAEKHVSVLIKAANRLTMQKFHVVVVGFGNDLDRLEDLASNLGIKDRVTFTGRIDEDDKADLLRSASIFVMPSPAELQSIATLEAMASGLPVVAVKAGALHELCVDGKNGLLYPLDDDKAMADRLAQLLDHPKLRLEMGKASLELARTHDLGTTIKAFEGLYEKVLRTHAQEAKQPELAGARTEQ
jgi:glycosyltransferase involved in cell wall biosynthesis